MQVINHIALSPVLLVVISRITVKYNIIEYSFLVFVVNHPSSFQGLFCFGCFRPTVVFCCCFLLLCFCFVAFAGVPKLIPESATCLDLPLLNLQVGLGVERAIL